MNIEEKLKIFKFEYFLGLLYEWHKTEDPYKSNDLNTLKIMKLLFFTSTMRNKEGEYSLLKTFDNNWAYPFGPVEESIFDFIREQEGKLTYFTIGKYSTTINGDFFTNMIELKNKIGDKNVAQIDSAMKSLKEINNQLINISAYDLVELSRLWYCWKKNYTEARKQGLNKIKINVDDIKKDFKIFSPF